MSDNPFAGEWTTPWFLGPEEVRVAPPAPAPRAKRAAKLAKLEPVAMPLPPAEPWVSRPATTTARPAAGLFAGGAAPVPEGWRPDEMPSLAGVTEAAVDFETTGLRWWAGDRPCGVCVAWREDTAIRSVYLPFAHQGGGNHDEARVREWMRAELRGKRIVNLNTKFDAHHAREWGVDWAGLAASLGDVAHYAALLDDHRGERWQREEKPFSLEALGLDYTGQGKVKGLDMPHGAHVHPAHLVTPYGRQDAALVLRVLDAQRPLLARDGLEAVAALEDEVQWAVLEMERNAAPLNVEKLARWCQESQDELTYLMTKLRALAGFLPNLNSADDLARLFRTRGVDLPEARTATGRQSFDGASLEAAAKQDEALALALTATRITDLRSKFLLAYQAAVSGDGRLRYLLNQLKGDKYGTVSGRFSSSAPVRGEGANVQQVYSAANQARRTGDRWIIRELFEAGTGLLLRADSSQIEYRIFAHFANDPKVLAAPPASMMAGPSRPWGLTAEGAREYMRKVRHSAAEILRAYEADARVDFHGIALAMMQRFQPNMTRDAAKQGNFAFLFGGGAGTGARLLGIEEEAAERLHNVYHGAMPTARHVVKVAEAQAEKYGYVRTALGRRARFRKGDKFYSAFNRIVQGTAADYHKLKLCALYRERKRLGLTLRMTVHDEVVGDVPEAAAATAVAALLDAPEPSLALRVPLLWEVKTGSNWRECK